MVSYRQAADNPKSEKGYLHHLKQQHPQVTWSRPHTLKRHENQQAVQSRLQGGHGQRGRIRQLALDKDIRLCATQMCAFTCGQITRVELGTDM